MAFIADNQIATILNYLTLNITGELFTSLLLVFIVLLSLAFAFNIEIEWTIIILFPYSLVCGAYYASWIPVVGILAIYLAIVLAKNFFFK
jgi:hypothetical protein